MERSTITLISLYWLVYRALYWTMMIPNILGSIIIIIIIIIINHQRFWTLLNYFDWAIFNSSVKFMVKQFALVVSWKCGRGQSRTVVAKWFVRHGQPFIRRENEWVTMVNYLCRRVLNAYIWAHMPVRSQNSSIELPNKDKFCKRRLRTCQNIVPSCLESLSPRKRNLKSRKRTARQISRGFNPLIIGPDNPTWEVVWCL